MFDLVHLTQKEGWQLNRAAIAIQTNFFSIQQEQEGIISLSKRITAVIRARRLDTKDLMEDIRNKESH